MSDYPAIPTLGLVDGEVDQLLNRLAAAQIDLRNVVEQPAALGRSRIETAIRVIQEAIDFVRHRAEMDPATDAGP
jgi:hypothetical protein